MNPGVLRFFTQPLGQVIMAAAMTGVAAALLGRKAEKRREDPGRKGQGTEEKFVRPLAKRSKQHSPPERKEGAQSD